MSAPRHLLIVFHSRSGATQELADGAGAVNAVQRIVTGLRWREIQEPVVITGEVSPADLDRCRELGASFAAALEIGMF